MLGRSPSDSDPLATSPAEGDASKLLKTKVRRLYDIANILSSLNLIEKVHTTNRKPAFKWLGPGDVTDIVADLKRGAEEHASAPAAKRRKSFAAAVPDHTGHGINADAGGFDANTLMKLDAVLQTFPDGYSQRWREYVKKLQTMLVEGKVTMEKAKECVAGLLEEAPSDGEVKEEQQSQLQPQTTTPNAKAPVRTDGQDTSPTQLMVAEQLSALAAKPITTTAGMTTPSQVASVGTGDVANSSQEIQPANGQSNTDANNSTAQGAGAAQATPAPVGTSTGDALQAGAAAPPAASAPSAAPVAAQGPGIGALAAVTMPFTWTQADVDQYMEQAREAGPMFLEAAEKWKQDLLKWQTVWGANLAALTSVQMQGPVGNLTPAMTKNETAVAKHS